MLFFFRKTMAMKNNRHNRLPTFTDQRHGGNEEPMQKIESGPHAGCYTVIQDPVCHGHHCRDWPIYEGGGCPRHGMPMMCPYCGYHGKETNSKIEENIYWIFLSFSKTIIKRTFEKYKAYPIRSKDDRPNELFQHLY